MSSPPSSNQSEEYGRWFKREFDKGNRAVVVAATALSVVVFGTLAIQLALVVALWFSVYPLASGATEKTVVLVAIFGGLAVFLGELSAIFQSSLIYLFLTRPRRRERTKSLDEPEAKAGP